MKPFSTNKSGTNISFHPKGGTVKNYWQGKKTVMKKQLVKERRRVSQKEIKNETLY